MNKILTLRMVCKPGYEVYNNTVFLQKIRHLLLFGTLLPNLGKIPLYSAREFLRISKFSIYFCVFSATSEHDRDQSYVARNYGC